MFGRKWGLEQRYVFCCVLQKMSSNSENNMSIYWLRLCTSIPLHISAFFKIYTLPYLSLYNFLPYERFKPFIYVSMYHLSNTTSMMCAFTVSFGGMLRTFSHEPYTQENFSMTTNTNFLILIIMSTFYCFACHPTFVQ